MSTEQPLPSATHRRPHGHLLRLLSLNVLGAVVVAAATITMIWLEAQSSPHDLARGESPWTVLLNPFVITFATPVILLSGVFAFLIVYYGLGDTVTLRTMAFLVVIVLVEVIVVGLYDPIAAWYSSYPTLLAAVGFSRWSSRRSPLGSNAS